MRRAAWQKYHDDSLVRTPDAGLRFGLEQLGKRQPAQAERADFEKIPAGNSVAEPLFGAVDS